MKKSRRQSFRWWFNCKSLSQREQAWKDFKDSVLVASEKREFYKLRKVHYEVGFTYSNKEQRKMYDRMRRLGIKYDLNYVIQK